MVMLDSGPLVLITPAPLLDFLGLGIFIVLIMTSTVILYWAVHLFAVSWNLSALFPQSDDRIRWGIVAVLDGMVFITRIMLPSGTGARRLMDNWLSRLALAMDVSLVPLLWILSIGWVRWQSREARG